MFYLFLYTIIVFAIFLAQIYSLFYIFINIVKQ
jgi:hypothetical protein